MLARFNCKGVLWLFIKNEDLDTIDKDDTRSASLRDGNCNDANGKVNGLFKLIL